MSSLWDKQKGDTKKSYAAFMDYCRMGAARSIRKLADRYKQEASRKKLNKPFATETTLFTWSAKDNWQERVEAWDEYEAEQSRAAWQARRAEVREADWDIAGKLREMALGILRESPNFMHTRRKLIKGKNGEPDREIITVGLNMQQALQAAKLASELQRLSAEMPDRFVDVTSGGKPFAPTVFLPEPEDFEPEGTNDSNAE